MRGGSRRILFTVLSFFLSCLLLIIVLILLIIDPLALLLSYLGLLLQISLIISILALAVALSPRSPNMSEILFLIVKIGSLLILAQLICKYRFR